MWEAGSAYRGTSEYAHALCQKRKGAPPPPTRCAKSRSWLSRAYQRAQRENGVAEAKDKKNLRKRDSLTKSRSQRRSDAVLLACSTAARDAVSAFCAACGCITSTTLRSRTVCRCSTLPHYSRICLTLDYVGCHRARTRLQAQRPFQQSLPERLCRASRQCVFLRSCWVRASNSLKRQAPLRKARARAPLSPCSLLLLCPLSFVLKARKRRLWPPALWKRGARERRQADTAPRKKEKKERGGAQVLFPGPAWLGLAPS